MSTGFVSETELAEARQKRQEEWEKVRTSEQPIERPEEPYDSRSLYERLKEQKMKKDLEFEEAHKLKNLIRGLDDDEVEFLDLVDRTKMKAEKEQMIEERNELNDFRQRVANLQEKSIEEKIQSEKASTKPKITVNTNRPSQKSILSGAVVRKRKINDSENVAEKRRSEVVPVQKDETTKQSLIASGPANNSNNSETLDRGAMKCIGILPGIGPYRESSDSEMSSGSEEEFDHFGKYDLVGRATTKTLKKCGESLE